MQFPVNLRIGALELPAHLIFEMLAYFVGFRFYLRTRERRGDVLAQGTRWTVVVAAALGGALGSKLLHHLASPTRFMEHWAEPGYVMGGKTIVGGLLGGVIAVEIAKKIWKVRGSTGDLFSIPLCLGMAVGRVGCFLAGASDDTVGGLTRVPWAVDFGDGPRHPTALYELLFLLVLALGLHRIRAKLKVQGRLFHLFMFAYLAFRWVCDFWKPYERLFGLRGIQWACVAGLLYYSTLLIRTSSTRTQDAIDV
ncbi:MAG: prolipoprotein diacylglyceryl transferase [Planctomycetes bacterium]|nr:prolipoprotein diacylglyceryl transferase [Planctomycetota bacterium]